MFRQCRHNAKRRRLSQSFQETPYFVVTAKQFEVQRVSPVFKDQSLAQAQPHLVMTVLQFAQPQASMLMRFPKCFLDTRDDIAHFVSLSLGQRPKLVQQAAVEFDGFQSS